MRGLLGKTIREVWLTTLLFGLALMAVKAVLTYVLPQIQVGLSEVLDQIPFVKPFLSALLATETGDEITARTMQAFLFVHPAVLSLIWALEIVICTRVPAGEIDRGTIDFLLGLPVSRRAVYASETIVWLAAGIIVITMGFVGHRLASPAMPAEMRPELTTSVIVLSNLFCVYVAVGGVAFLVSSFCNRRGKAVGIVFAVVLSSFLLNFVSQFWAPAKQFAFLSVLEYYRPALVMRSGQFPVGDVIVLLSIGLVAWTIGGEVMARRNICTV
jgi:beta-exotoxin I transport system permease protein